MKAYRYRLPLTKPLQLGGRWIIDREGLLLQGENGWAEAAPLPAFSQERLEDVIEEFRKRTKEYAPSLAFARDAANRPLTKCEIPINALLHGKTDEILTRSRQLSESSCQAVKLKLGRSNDIRSDIELTVVVRKTLRSDQRLRLDANRAWDLTTAKTFAAGISDCVIDYMEEPLQDSSKLEEFFEASGLPYALDETLAETDKLEAFPHAAALVVKPTIVGGRKRIERFAALGTPIVFSACFESGVGISRIAQLANEFSPGIPAGLDTYSWLATDVLVDRLCIRDWHLIVEPELSVKAGMLEEIAP